MLTIVLLSPLVFSLIVGLIGRLFGVLGAKILANVGMCINLCITFFLCYWTLGQQFSFYSQLLNWIYFSGLIIEWTFCLDTMSIIMFVVVNCVSCVVHMFSTSYMTSDPHFIRFMSYISLFTAFMLILVTGDNLLQLFLGWEGVGLCSYLLISFWYTRVDAVSSGLKALIVNRISDFFFLIALLLVGSLFCTLEFPIIYAVANFFIYTTISVTQVFIVHYLFLGCLFLTIGAMGKSAQILLHTWLPDAMEGPTPVSALIHAATMVTAGIFLVLRCSIFFEMSHTILSFLLFVGGLTAFISGTIGVVQFDMKKVIAYSTCSQLGYMLFACGAANFFVSFFHLMNHAFFKALLFLCAGCVIHSCYGEQDFRVLGGLYRIVPVTSFYMFVGSLALGGLPFLAGFYSKDFILEHFMFMHYTYDSYFFWSCTTLLVVISSLLTAYYTFRLFVSVFLKQFNFFKNLLNLLHESPEFMIYPLFLLYVGSLFIGFIASDLFIGVSNSAILQLMASVPINNFLFETELILPLLKLTFFIVLLALSSALIKILVRFKNNNSLFFFNIRIYTMYMKPFLCFFVLFNSKWFFDCLYNRFINSVVFEAAFSVSYEVFDKILLERFFGNFIILRLTTVFFTTIRNIFQNGLIYVYIVLFPILLFLLFSVFVSFY